MGSSNAELCAEFSSENMEPGFIAKLVRQDKGDPFATDGPVLVMDDTAKDSDGHRPVFEFLRGIKRLKTKQEIFEASAGYENVLFVFLGGPFADIDYEHALEQLGRYGIAEKDGLPVHFVEGEYG